MCHVDLKIHPKRGYIQDRLTECDLSILLSVHLIKDDSRILISAVQSVTAQITELTTCHKTL